MQVVGAEEVQAKIGALGGALQQFDTKAAVTAQTTGQTLPAGFQATSQSAERATKSVQSSTQGFQTAALGLTSAASGAFALYNQYDRLEKIQVRIAASEKAVTTAERASLDSKRALNDLVAKGITSGAQYESAVLRVSQAEQQQAIAADRLSIAQTDLTQGQLQLGLTVLPTVFSAVSGVTTAMTAFRAAQTATAGSSLLLTPALGGTTAALHLHTGALTLASLASRAAALGMRILHIAMGPIGWIILAVGAALTLFATNAFGVRDAINAAGKAIGDAVPILRPLLEALSTLANAIFPETGKEADAMADETTAATQRMADSSVASVGRTTDALDKLRDKFKEFGSATTGASTGGKSSPSFAQDLEDPILERISTGLSGKRQKIAEEKLGIIKELVELTTGIRTSLEDLPTEAPDIEKLAEDIRDQLQASVGISFDFEAEDIDAEFEKVRDALTRRTGTLSIDMQIRHENLERDLASIEAQIENTEERLRTVSGGRGLEELRGALAGGELTQAGDEFVVHLLGKLDELGEKAVDIKERMREITHVEFEPTAAPESTRSAGEAAAFLKANAEVKRAIEERIKAIEQLQSLIEGADITLTESAKKDIAGLKQLAKEQQDAINEMLKESGSDVRLDFGAEDLQAELAEVTGALKNAQNNIVESTGGIQSSVTGSFQGVEQSAESLGVSLDAGLSKATASVAGSTSKIESQLISLRGTFFSTFNLASDAMGIFARGVDKYADQIAADVKRIEKALDDIGISGSKASKFLDLGSAARGAGSGSRAQEVKVTLSMSDDLKTIVKKAAVEQMGGNL